MATGADYKPDTQRRQAVLLSREWACTSVVAFWVVALLSVLALVSGLTILVLRVLIPPSYPRQARYISPYPMVAFSQWAFVAGSNECSHVPRSNPWRVPSMSWC